MGLVGKRLVRFWVDFEFIAARLPTRTLCAFAALRENPSDPTIQEHITYLYFAVFWSAKFILRFFGVQNLFCVFLECKIYFASFFSFLCYFTLQFSCYNCT
jgi:hypothetical protein